MCGCFLLLALCGCSVDAYATQRPLLRPVGAEGAALPVRSLPVKRRKGSACDVMYTCLRQVPSHVDDVTDCRIQNGSAHGLVFATLKGQLDLASSERRRREEVR